MTRMIGKKQERLYFAYWTRKIKRLKNRQSGPISPAVLKQFLRVCPCPNFHSLWKIFSPATVWKMPSRRHKISGGRTGLILPNFSRWALVTVRYFSAHFLRSFLSLSESSLSLRALLPPNYQQELPFQRALDYRPQQWIVHLFSHRPKWWNSFRLNTHPRFTSMYHCTMTNRDILTNHQRILICNGRSHHPAGWKIFQF